MGSHERRPRVARQQRLETVDDLFERWEPRQVGAVPRPRRPEVPVRVLAELLVALVHRVERLEEGDRVGDVDGDRDAQLPRRRPEGIQPRVVDGHDPARPVTRGQPERLPGLQPAGARGYAGVQPSRLLLAEVGPLGPHRVVETGEDGHPAAERRPALDLARQPGAVAPVEVDDAGDRRGVENGPQLGGRRVRPAPGEGRRPEVVVGVDGRHRGPGDQRGRHAQLRAWPEVAKEEVVGGEPTGIGHARDSPTP